MQPLVLRPAYGEGRSPVAEAKLPEGDPAGKGLSLDDSIPGQKTFNKPEGDERDFDKKDPGSIYKRETPDEVAKPQSDTDREKDENHHENFKPTFAPPGGRPKDDKAITKYPYRMDHDVTHNAATAFVYGAYVSARAHSLTLPVQGETLKVATRLEAIETGLNPAVTNKAAQCSVKLKRSDVPNLRWLFNVDCGNGPKVVRLKAERTARVTQMPKMELHVSCSCPAWRWLGPEHHSKREQYLDGQPRGTASVPVIRDPEGKNRVCKHVAAVLSAIRQWKVPAAKDRQIKPK